MKNLILKFLLFQGILLFSIGCAEDKRKSSADITITISVKDEVVVNSDTVSIDSLESKLAQLGVTDQTNIKVVPDPEAGAGTIDRVQRTIRIVKQSRK